MKRIEHLTKVDLTQALRCVEYRLPRNLGLKPSGLRLALGVRYGLVGAAAVCHLLSDAEFDEEKGVFRAADRWPKMVEEHARKDAMHRLGLPPEPEGAREIAAWARQCLFLALDGRDQMLSLVDAFREATETMIAERRREILGGWNVFAWRKADRVFRLACASSITYAHAFFERRGYSIEEVPEIALLGE